MSASPSAARPEPTDVYRCGLAALQTAGIPVLVGGAYALSHYSGIARPSKDFDLFLRHADLDRALRVLAQEGFETEVPYPHWLAKARVGDDFIDLIFRSGNGVSGVDDGWFERAPEREVLGLTARLVPAEEMLWTKAFIMERERFDGADVAHLILGHDLDWDVLLQRFEPHWQVLFAHLVLFGFIYPSERERVPVWVIDHLTERLRQEARTPPPPGRLCQGTLLSRAQYLVEVEAWGYSDGRLQADIQMTADDVQNWTDAIDDGDRPHE